VSLDLGYADSVDQRESELVRVENTADGDDAPTVGLDGDDCVDLALRSTDERWTANVWSAGELSHDRGHQCGSSNALSVTRSFSTHFASSENFDSVTPGRRSNVKITMWDPSNSDHTLPASFYLHAKPTWWPAGSPWPWVGPDVMPMVGTLPAKARYDAMP
jgi:hypothetical protein